MSIAKFSVGRRGMSGRHASYITRESACRDLSFHNLDELKGANNHENRVNAIAHAYSREDIEMLKGGERGRTHYKLILSWDRQEDPEKVKEITHKFLKENFEKGRGIVAIHGDTKQTHAHVLLDARGTDGRKLHLARDAYRQLDERWAQAYDREYETNYAPEYAEKKAQTLEWKRELATRDEERDGKQQIPLDKPDRARDELTGSIWREKELRDTGVERNAEIEKNNDESRIRGNQQSFEVRDRRAEGTEHQLSSSQQQLDKSEREADQANYELERGTSQTDRTKQSFRELQPTVERVAEKQRDVERNQSRERDGGLER